MKDDLDLRVLLRARKKGEARPIHAGATQRGRHSDPRVRRRATDWKSFQRRERLDVACHLDIMLEWQPRAVRQTSQPGVMRVLGDGSLFTAERIDRDQSIHTFKETSRCLASR